MKAKAAARRRGRRPIMRQARIHAGGPGLGPGRAAALGKRTDRLEELDRSLNVGERLEFDLRRRQVFERR